MKMSEEEAQNADSVKIGEKEQIPSGSGDDGDALGSRGIAVHRFAKMPVDRDAPYYNMKHKDRGMAVIFNHEHFDVHSLKSLTGNRADSDKLAKALKSLGFRVTMLNNLKAIDVIKYVQETAEMDHSDSDCLLVAVLTHGEMGFLYAKDTHYKPDSLWYYFTADKCPSLAGKPKMFFIQASQGNKFDGGMTLTNRTETDGYPNSAYKIPIHADFLIMFSTAPGFHSWENTSQNLSFIHALCEELREYGTERNILTLLTFVCQKLAMEFESNTPDTLTMHQQKQVPCISSMLTRLLIFEKKPVAVH